VLGPVLAAAIFIEISIAVLGSSLVALGTEGASDLEAGFGTPASIGLLLLEDFLIAFEVASLLLLVTAVAAIVLAGRKPGEEGVES
jgi:NADH:ubiquinone oxidoreductase subunit 6 (subunit J)